MRDEGAEQGAWSRHFADKHMYIRLIAHDHDAQSKGWFRRDFNF